MAKTYTTTIKVRCWKEHTCLNCGGVYSYPFARDVKGKGPTPERSSQTAQRNVARVLARDVDPHPCPACGAYQPDMVGQRRARTHKLVFWIALIALAVLLVLRASDVLQSNVATWVIAAGCALAALVHLVAELKNPNKDPEANRRLATEELSSGKLRHQPGRPVPRGQQLNVTPRPVLAQLGVIGLLAAVAAAASPEVLRAMRGWPLNADCYTPVVGPGDSTRVYMPQKISSVKGYWRGDPLVSLQDPASPGSARLLTATTNRNDWGHTISAKPSEKQTSSSPWVELEVPDDANLAGKTAQCDIALAVQYPEVVGSSDFEVHQALMQHNVTLHLAPAGAGRTYRSWWWQGTLLGVGLVLVCGLVLLAAARSLQRRATPTRIYTDAPVAGQAVPAGGPPPLPPGTPPVVPPPLSGAV